MTRLHFTRRSALAALGAGVFFPAGARAMTPAPALPKAAWESWKSAFVRPEGRVVDPLQQNASHSESQGYGMTLATAFRDHIAFEQMRGWTRTHLRIRETDGLHAWRWLPDQTPQVPDLNNATDGDLFIAWALWRAAGAFGRPDYLEEARTLVQAISDLCLVDVPGHPGALVILPGREGFAAEGRVVINPAYTMPRALMDLAHAFDLPRLANAAQTSRLIVDQLSQSLLPPDWVEIGAGGMVPAPNRPDVFGYEAMRVPVFEIWSRRPDAPAVRQAARLYAAAREIGTDVPTRVGRSTWDVIEVSDEPGYRALAHAVMCSAPGGGGTINSASDFMAPNLTAPNFMAPNFIAQQNYYPATLHLMAMVALFETDSGCPI